MRTRAADLESIDRLEELLARMGKTRDEISALFDQQWSAEHRDRGYLRADWVAREISKAERYLDGV